MRNPLSYPGRDLVRHKHDAFARDSRRVLSEFQDALRDNLQHAWVGRMGESGRRSKSIQSESGIAQYRHKAGSGRAFGGYGPASDRLGNPGGVFLDRITRIFRMNRITPVRHREPFGEIL
jgi:hypothetical protein